MSFKKKFSLTLGRDRGSRSLKSSLVPKEEHVEEAPKQKEEDSQTTGELQSNDSSNEITTLIEEEEEEEGLIFSTGEVSNGRPVIKGGNIQKLVERLTFHKYNDVKYSTAFMLTFRSFTTPSELLQLLINRYHIQPPSEASAEEKSEFDKVQNVVRLRVFNVLKNWLNGGYYDFSADEELKTKLKDFIQKEMAASMKNPSQTLLNIIEKKESAVNKEYEIIFTTPPPKPILPQNVTAQNQNSILTYHPLELARQLTLIEYRLYVAIKPAECLGQNWMSKKKEELAPNILAMISHFNYISNWISSEVVKCADLRERTLILKHAIEIAEALKSLNNFNGLMEIISGLHSSSVYRLKQTWAGIPKKLAASFEEMHAIMSRDKSYKLFRSYLHTANPPCIPYLGMYLTDLTFIEDGNKDNLSDGHINFKKRQLLAEVISEILVYQNTPYCLEELSFVKEYLLNVEALPEQQCYSLSTKRETKTGILDDQTPDLPFGEMEDAPNYLFDKPDTEDTILFDQDGLITATSLEKLIERVTYHESLDKKADKNLQQAFLMSIKSISTPMKILELLDNRFNMPRPKNPSKQQKAKFHSTRMMPIHARIFKLLTAWVNYYPEDFILDTDFQNRVLELTHKWCETNHLLKPNYDHLIKLLEKKLAEPLQTPECRFLGFLRSSDAEDDQSVTDFKIELVAQQLTLIEQNFFQSIKARECLCPEWDEKGMEKHAPNFLAIKSNFTATRRWTLTEILKRPEPEQRAFILSFLTVVAEKLIEIRNFSSAMAMTSALMQLYHDYSSIWEYVPVEIVEKYKELEGLYKLPKRMKSLEESDTPVPLIPYIDGFMLQLNGIAAFETDDRGKLINWEKKRQLFNIVKALQRFGKITFTYDYSGTAGGYLFNAEIWPDDVIRARVEDLPKDLPESRLLLTDFPQFNELIDDGIGDVDKNVNEQEEATLSQIRNYFTSVITEEGDLLRDIIEEAKSALTDDFMSSLREFTSTLRDELSLIQTAFGFEKREDSNKNDATAERILNRIFPDCSISSWNEVDDEGIVYGWEDQVSVFKVDSQAHQYLAYITPHLDKSDVSVILRLFEFFNQSSETQWENVIISPSCSSDIKSVLNNKKISLLDFSGTKI